MNLGVTRFTLKKERNSLTPTGINVTIQAVVADVQFAVVEPLSKRCVRPIQGLSEGLVPVKLSGLIGPEL